MPTPKPRIEVFTIQEKKTIEFSFIEPFYPFISISSKYARYCYDIGYKRNVLLTTNFFKFFFNL